MFAIAASDSLPSGKRVTPPGRTAERLSDRRRQIYFGRGIIARAPQPPMPSAEIIGSRFSGNMEKDRGMATVAAQHRPAGGPERPCLGAATRAQTQAAATIPTTARAMIAVAPQPITRIAGGIVNAPMTDLLTAMSIMMAITGTATTPLITALQ